MEWQKLGKCGSFLYFIGYKVSLMCLQGLSLVYIVSQMNPFHLFRCNLFKISLLPHVEVQMSSSVSCSLTPCASVLPLILETKFYTHIKQYSKL